MTTPTTPTSATLVEADDLIETLDRFFAAIEAQDIRTVESLYADDIEVYHNWTQATLGRDAALEVLRSTGAITGLRYEIISRHVGDGFVVQRHVLHGAAPGGELAIPVCILIEVSDGRITRIYEYLDSAAIVALR
jgi:uncharacterized protein